MRLPISDQYQPNCLATVHPWQTNRRTDENHDKGSAFKLTA